MSDEEVRVETTDGQILAAEYKDGQLQIVEMSAFDKDREGSLLPLTDSGDQQTKYMQVLDTNKGLVQLDLLNLTLVRCSDGEDGYQLVANSDAQEGLSSDETVTCVLQSSDTEDPDNQDSYVMVDAENAQGLMFLKSSLQEAASSLERATTHEDEIETTNLATPLQTPAEILQREKALQRVKVLLANSPRSRKTRKRKSDLPPPHELLASPNFKLYLYSCKMCPFKCNAVKEMSAHKAAEHGTGTGATGVGARRAGGSVRGAHASLQCARCPYRATAHSQLMRHVQEKHLKAPVTHMVNLDTEEVENADVLVCGACGFESGSRIVFKEHIEQEHGATTSC